MYDYQIIVDVLRFSLCTVSKNICLVMVTFSILSVTLLIFVRHSPCVSKRNIRWFIFYSISALEMWPKRMMVSNHWFEITKQVFQFSKNDNFFYLLRFPLKNYNMFIMTYTLNYKIWLIEYVTPYFLQCDKSVGYF